MSRVVEGGSLADGQILQGNPVFLQVDHEAVLEVFGKTASGDETGIGLDGCRSVRCRPAVPFAGPAV